MLARRTDSSRRPSLGVIGAVGCALLMGGCSGDGVSPRGGVTPTPSAAALPQVVADCEHLALRPREIGVACGDGNYALSDAAYDRWTSEGAQGRAVAVRNTCEPSCAEGNFTKTPVAFRLDRLLQVYGVPVFTRLTVLDPATGRTLLVTPLLPMGCTVEPPSCPPTPTP